MKIKTSYVKATVFVAVLAIALIGLMHSSAAEAPLGAPGADLTNEERTLSKYADELIVFETQCAELSKKAALANADIDPLQRKSDDLKGRLSGVQNSVREVVRKLKAANEWDGIDSKVAASITDPKLKSLLQDTSFKQDLEEAAGGLGSRASEISAPLDSLRKRLTGRYNGGEVQFVRAATAPAPFANHSLGCQLGRLGIRITRTVLGTVPPAQSDRVFNRCNPAGPANPF